jgi:hypothetical protein
VARYPWFRARADALRAFDDAPGLFADDPIGARLNVNSEDRTAVYEACPDADVFGWDEAHMEAVESYEKKSVFGLGGTVRQDYEEDVETKEILVMARRVQGRLLDIDKEAASILQDACLREVRQAVSARNSYDGRHMIELSAATMFWFFSPMFAAVLVSLWVGSHRGWWLLLLGPAELAVFWLAFIGLAAGEARFRHWANVVGAGVLIWCVVAAFIVGFHYRNHNPGLPIELSAGIAVAGLIFAFGFALIGFVVSIFDYRGQGAQPETLLLIDLLSLITIAMEWEVADDKRKDLIEKLEETAELAERTFPYAASHSIKRLRKWGADRGRRIAAVLRKHQERVLEVSTAQRGLITISLINGVIYLVKRDWDSLLVVEPEGEVRSIVRRYLPRAALAALLVILAFLLPHLLPHVITDAVSFEATLIVTAGFTLINPDVQRAYDSVRSFSR